MAKKKLKKKSTGNEPSNLAKLDFETSMSQLADVVGDLEDGQLGLSSSLARYEEGVHYLKHCLQLLETAEQKISLLTGVDANGNPATEAYDHDDLDLEEKAKSRSKRRTAGGGGRAAKSTSHADDSDGLF